MPESMTLKLAIEYDQASGQAVVRGIERIDTALEGVGTNGAQVGAQGGAGLEQLGRTADTTSGLLSGLGRQFLALGLVEGLRQIGSAALSAGIESEQLRTQLTQMEGSAEGAERRLRALDETAAELGMGLGDTAAAFVKLKDLGLDPSARALEAYANIAAAKSKSIAQYVEAVADASTGEFETLKGFGIKAGIEGDKVVLRFKGQSLTIANDAKSIEEALIRIGEVEYAGAAAAQAQTTGAALSQLADVSERLLAKWGRDSGLVGVTGELARGLTDVMRALEQTGQQSTQTSVAVAAGVKAFNTALSPMGTIAREGLKAAGGIDGLLGRAADVIRFWRGVDVSAQAAADATAEYAAGTRTAGTAIGPLTEQQALLIAQTQDMVTVDTAAAKAKAALGQAATAASAALSAAAAVLGTDVTALQTGVSAADRAIIQAFSDIATTAGMSGLAISRAYEAALGKVTQRGIPGLVQAWQRARTEGQITTDEFDRGTTLLNTAIQRVGVTIDTHLTGALQRTQGAATTAFGTLTAEVADAQTGMDRLIARAGILAEEYGLLAQLKAGTITSVEFAAKTAELERLKLTLTQQRREELERSAEAERAVTEQSQETADALDDGTAAAGRRTTRAARGRDSDSAAADATGGSAGGADDGARRVRRVTTAAPAERTGTDAGGVWGGMRVSVTTDLEEQILDLKRQVAVMQPLSIPVRLRAVDDDEIGLAATVRGARV